MTDNPYQPYQQMLRCIISLWALSVGSDAVRECLRALVEAREEVWRGANLRNAGAVGNAEPYSKMLSLLVFAWSDDSGPCVVRSALRILVDRDDFWSALPHMTRGGISGGADALEREGFDDLATVLKGQEIDDRRQTH